MSTRNRHVSLQVYAKMINGELVQITADDYFITPKSRLYYWKKKIETTGITLTGNATRFVVNNEGKLEGRSW